MSICKVEQPVVEAISQALQRGQLRNDSKTADHTGNELRVAYTI